ncbi:hypothetical protein XBKB1_1890001 [Xenorhabdus bovienii str. kraussei Becker Underwood]|uniref:Uncharacterized protein n=1 Tax=Xenorhabdus bovienii str. kraussei Becker Underwood TaxID=1398204 RepID=A0A077PSN2_XENBV|nr:hypothetical protein XBKB1_1890001 [Xenorhabdus bovienii str. kraussei Becker Underwood]
MMYAAQLAPIKQFLLVMSTMKLIQTSVLSVLVIMMSRNVSKFVLSIVYLFFRSWPRLKSNYGKNL